MQSSPNQRLGTSRLLWSVQKPHGTFPAFAPVNCNVKKDATTGLTNRLRISARSSRSRATFTSISAFRRAPSSISLRASRNESEYCIYKWNKIICTVCVNKRDVLGTAVWRPFCVQTIRRSELDTRNISRSRFFYFFFDGKLVPMSPVIEDLEPH